MTICMLASGAPTASAGTLTTSRSAFLAGVGGATVTTTGASGVFDTSQFTLPTTNLIPLLDGSSLALVNFDQVQQPPSGNGGYPFFLSNGYAGDVFSPENAAGTPLTSETITLSNGQTALGFLLLPNSDNSAGAFSTITATLSDGKTTQITLANGNLNTGTATPAFIGFFGGGETSITISTNDPNGFAFGNFVDVPEPASAALLLAGLACARLRFRRRVPAV